MTIDKLLRAQVAFVLFAAAYLAEVVRGGLQAIPKGQIEAADALGLGYWQRTRLIVLPQALAMVDPAAGQHLHRHLQGHLARHHHRPVRPARHRERGDDRSELARLLSSRPMASSRAIYFSFCFFMSRYSQMLEREFNRAGGASWQRAPWLS